MPLSILIPIVVFGVAGLVWLIWYVRPTPAFTIQTPDQAIRVWNHFNLETPAISALLNPDHTHALLTTKTGTGLLWSFGADPVSRLFPQPVECKSNAAGIRIVTRDFTAPSIHIPLPDTAQQSRWTAILKGKA